MWSILTYAIFWGGSVFWVKNTNQLKDDDDDDDADDLFSYYLVIFTSHINFSATFKAYA